MKILITGGAGFIASHIADAYIELGHDVVIIDNLSTGFEENINPKAKFYKLDITSPEIIEVFEKEKFDIISHHAAQMNVRFSVENPIIDSNINILGSLNLYEAAVKTGVKKVIFASTGGAVYGETDIIPTPETTEPRPCSPYGISKLTNEKFLFYYNQVYNLDYTILRYANVFGSRQNPQGEAGVVAIFINKMLRGDQPIINGDGLYTRDYVHISDVVAANILSLDDNKPNIYNIGTGIETTTNEIFRTIKNSINADCPEVHGEAKKGEQRRSCISYKKIKQELNWEPKVSLEQGIKETVDFFRSKNL
jgi:UDP-glucose 4-epimerase